MRWPGVVYLPPPYYASPNFDMRFYYPQYYDSQYFDPQYYETPVEPAPVEATVVAPAATGRLILDPQPEGAQVFVDGYYAGIPEDFSSVSGGGVLQAGQHRIDISAPGFEAVSLDVNIAPSQTLTYEGTLMPLPKRQDEQPGKPTIFYLIPGCYMGNIHPRDVKLPATCDLRAVVEFKY